MSRRALFIPHIVEMDRERAASRIAEVKALIDSRLQLISQDANHLAEQLAIRDAMVILRILENERLGPQSGLAVKPANA